MHAISHLHIHNYTKTVKFLHVLNLTGSSSGNTSSSFVQNTSSYLYYVINSINKLLMCIGWFITYYKYYLMHVLHLIIF